jgi:hypothetical protein
VAEAQAALPALNLGSHERGELQADIENRVDGADLVSELLELLVSDLAVKEDIELEALRVCVVASNEVQDVLCAMVTKWNADVLLCTAEKFTRFNSLELELMAKRRLCCSRAADEFASSIPASSALPVSKFRLFFWLLERRLWYLFSAALRDSDHSALVVPAAVPLLEADVHWLGPLLAYLAGWAFEQKNKYEHKRKLLVFARLLRLERTRCQLLHIRRGFLHPLLLVFAPLLRLERTRCQLSSYSWRVAAPPARPKQGKF